MSLFDTGIKPAVDDYLQAKRDEERDYGDYWSASNAGYCMRKLIFDRLKVPHSTEEDERKQRVFEVGNIFHKWLQDITKQSGLSMAQELELQDEELMIRGHIDDLILKDGKLILYDYKTAHSRSFHYSKGKPMSHYHKMQLGTYLYMIRKHRAGTENELIWQVEDARILKISKDDLCMEEKQLLWSSELEKEVYGYWSTLSGYWESKKLPKCTCADYENGFMARKDYNPYFYDGEPCSIKYYEKWKKSQVKEEK